MKFKKITTAVIASLFVLSFAIAGVAQAQSSGLGISPSRLTVDHMLRDSEYRQTFMLSHGDHSEAKFLQVLVDESIEGWITTEHGLEFTWPEARDSEGAQFPLEIIVKAPSDAPNGNYKGTIRIVNTSSVDAAKSGSSANVVLAVAIKADLTLSDQQVLDYEIHAISVIPKVEEDSPLETIVHIENKGNVRAKPTKIEVDFYDKFNETFLGEYDETDLDSIGAFVEDGVITVNAIHGLSVGQYWARVLVYRDNTVLKEEDVVFEVVPTGSLSRKGEIVSFDHEQNIGPGEILKIVATFKNTGKVDVTAKLSVEVYDGSSLVEVLEGDGRRVRVGKSEELTVFFTPEKEGKYKLVGKVEYSGQVTSSSESSVRVGAVVGGGVSLPVILIIVIVLIVAIVGGILFLKSKKTPSVPLESNEPETAPAEGEDTTAEASEDLRNE